MSGADMVRTALMLAAWATVWFAWRVASKGDSTMLRMVGWTWLVWATPAALFLTFAAAHGG